MHKRVRLSQRLPSRPNTSTCLARACSQRVGGPCSVSRGRVGGGGCILYPWCAAACDCHWCCGCWIIAVGLASGRRGWLLNSANFSTYSCMMHSVLCLVLSFSWYCYSQLFVLAALAVGSCSRLTRGCWQLITAAVLITMINTILELGLLNHPSVCKVSQTCCCD